MTEGNWRVGVFVDERASDAQFEKLVQVFSGQLGGPMAGIPPLIGQMLGVERAAIEVDQDGLSHRVRVGSAIDGCVAWIRDPGPSWDHSADSSPSGS